MQLGTQTGRKWKPGRESEEKLSNLGTLYSSENFAVSKISRVLTFFKKKKLLIKIKF